MSRGKSVRSIHLIATAQTILEEIEPASVRAVCYRLFVLGLIPSMSKSATNGVSRQLTWAREQKIIPWEWIVDESRQSETVAAWANTDELINAAVKQYRRDYWQDQPRRVEVWSEKGTVRGALSPVLNEFGVTFRVMHGYASTTVAKDIAKQSQANAKPLIVFYVGDWDPSGLHMCMVDLPRRLERYDGEVQMVRISLRKSDINGLPTFDPESKRSDPRYRWFMDTISTRCSELDALPPPELRGRVRTAIEAQLDMKLWQHAKTIEAAEVEAMREFGKSWQASKCSVGA